MKQRWLRPNWYALFEKIITRAKVDSVHNRRLVFAKLRDNEIVHQLFTDLGIQYANHPGGYIRILKNRFRHGDNALMVIMQFVEPKAPAKPKKAAKKPAAKKAAPKAEAVESAKTAAAETPAADASDAGDSKE